MSWFQKLRSKSVNTQSRPPTGVRSLYGKVMVDPQTCLEVFKNHWRQAYTIMCRHIPTQATIYHRVALTGDEVQAVVNYVDQMMNLLVEEETVNGKIGPMLQFLTNEGIMEKLLDWSVEHSQFADEMKHEQLKVYETLLCGSPQPVLHQKHILNPLLRLLGMCSDANTVEIENHLILLLNQLCVSLYKDPSLLEQFFNAKADHGPAKFLIFSLLIPYVHREGRIGQQARDALLLCMSLSAENETVGTYIAENSNFCHVLATGLSGLYSSLPRKIEIRSDDWHALRKEDYVNAPALLMFLNSLEFCNAVAQVAHPMVRNQLLELLYNGFLVPVMGPALHKTSVDEVIASTTYFDLFLRTITEPALMKAFLRFITTATYDDHLVMDALISRITSNSRISVVTLALFRTVVSLNCEDVMLELVLKYLVPCTHVMVSQRRSVKEADLYGKTSEKFLSLTPDCCRIDNNANQQAAPVAIVTNIGIKGNKATPVTTIDQKVAEQKVKEKADLRRFETSYMEYLQDARVGIGQSWKACKCWSAPYDGDNPPEDSVKAEDLHWGQIKNYDRKERVVYGTSRGRSASFHPRSPSEGVELRPRLGSAPVKSRQMDETPDSGLSSGSDTKPDNEWSLTFKGGRIEAHSPSKTRRKISPTTSSSDSLHSIHSIVDVEVHVDGKKTDDKAKERVAVNGEMNEGAKKEEQEGKELKSEDLGTDEQKIVQNGEEEEEKDRDETDGKEKKDAEDENDDDEEDEAVSSMATTPSPGMSPPQTPHGELPQSPTNFRPLHLAFSPIAAQEDKSRIGSPNTGPFIAALFSKLETMMSNSLYVNLLLTGILRQLSYYPLPLLRSFLLNTNLVFQPSVKSLVQILSSVKNKIDYYSQSVENFQGLVVRGRNFLSYREQVLYDSESNQMILKDKKQAVGQSPSPQTTPAPTQPPKPQPPPPVPPVGDANSIWEGLSELYEHVWSMTDPCKC
ncbi:FTS and Hook-interacting protein-like isoform X2 [Branchiostoma floridae]|uniref:FTS and Hook-interacting protein-like isoform X2 n=1 Tax=Branchiostoma floridae TaxID=7739 RepID=A0A9J7LFP8_BRAFL|nr:FTS and Hook-interacting protein-like isoform X2 [Branchiostoma floridae]